MISTCHAVAEEARERGADFGGRCDPAAHAAIVYGRRSMTDRPPVFTIGHSTHPIEHFVALLQQHGIEVLADVRSTPFSRFNPQFNRASARAEPRIGAAFATSSWAKSWARAARDPACFENGRVSYARLARDAALQARPRALCSRRRRSQRVAMMCAEREPLDCHRTILVTRELERAGAAVRAHPGGWRARDESADDGAAGRALGAAGGRSVRRYGGAIRGRLRGAGRAKIAYAPKEVTRPGKA